MIKRTIKRIVKEVTIGTCTLDNSNKDVQKLMKLERKFKKHYKVDMEVKYIDAKYKEYITRKTVKGMVRKNKDYIIVFVDGNVRRNAETLFHELTHAYQVKYMNRQFTRSDNALRAGRVSYIDCWHETHARHCAHLLVNSLDFSIDLKQAMDYVVAC